MPTGNPNPKDYPYFPELVATLKSEGHEIIQIGVKGEAQIDGVDRFIQGRPLRKLKELVESVDTWISVDNFFPHYCFCERLKAGIVIFGQSDPVHFSHSANTNLLKSSSYLRPFQFSHWFDIPFREDAFVEPQVVMDALHGRLFNNAPAKS